MDNRQLWQTIGKWVLPCTMLSNLGAAQSGEEAVLTVGSQTVTRSAIERGLKSFSPADLVRLGHSPAERVRGFLDQHLIPELLLANHAITAGLDKSPLFRLMCDQALSAALERALAKEIEDTLSESEIRAYFELHRAEFEVPDALLIWRILVDSPELAVKIAAEGQGALGPARWRALAEDHSLDTSSKHQGGALGFIRADGSSDNPTLRVAPELYKAASEVTDGQIVGTPVVEGQHFAVVWRRGTRTGHAANFAQATPRIRSILVHEKTQAALRTLLSELNQRHTHELQPKWLELQAPELPSFTPVDDFPRSQGNQR